MTQKEIEEFLADTKVYVNGKSREIQEKLFSYGYHWGADSCRVRNTEKPFIYIYKEKNITYCDRMDIFDKHRNRQISSDDILDIKLDELRYRPFKGIEECYNEMLNHQPFGWVKTVSGICYNIATIDNTSIYFCDTTQCFYRDALENHFFMDGTPFGIKEE